jgi:hypothetical protein
MKNSWYKSRINNEFPSIFSTFLMDNGRFLPAEYYAELVAVPWLDSTYKAEHLLQRLRPAKQESCEHQGYP